MNHPRARLAKIVSVLFVLLFLLLSGVVCKKAKPKEESHVLAFDANGGEEVASVTFKTGDELTLPDAVFLDHVFMGWFTEVTDGLLVESGITSFTTDMTLHAHWGVRVTFDAQGGTEIASQVVSCGSTLESLPVALKSGYLFRNWYTDESGTTEYAIETVLDANITLYALYSKTSANVLAKVRHVELEPMDPGIAVTSPDALSDDTVSEHLTVANEQGLDVPLVVAPTADGYLLRAQDGFLEGNSYVITIQDETTNVTSVGGSAVEEGCTQVTFSIRKPNFSDIEEAEIKRVLNSRIFDAHADIYSVQEGSRDAGKSVTSLSVLSDDDTFAAGDILSIGESAREADTDLYVKVVAAHKETITEASVTIDYWCLEVIDASLEDIYTSFDSYTSSAVTLGDYFTASAASIENEVASSEGIATLNASLQTAIASSATVEEILATLPDADRELVSKSIATFRLGVPKVSFHIEGDTVTMDIALSGEIDFSGYATLTISVEMQDELALSYATSTVCVKNVILGIFDKYLISVNATMTNDFTLSLSAEVEFSGTGDEDDEKSGKKVDIFDELDHIIDGGKNGWNGFAQTISGSALFKDGDEDLEYQDVVDTPVVDIPIPVTNIITFSIGLDAVISIGAKAGLYVELAQQFVEQVTIANGCVNPDGSVTFYDGFQVFQNQLANSLALDITIKGRIGVRCGLAAKLTVGILHTNDLASVFVSATYGPYVELVGLAHFTYKYDALTKTETTDIYGGMYVEVGAFVDIKIGVKFLSIDSDKSLWTYKLKLFTIGSTKCPICFSSDTDGYTYTVNTKTFTVGPYSYYLKVDYVDLTTGSVVKGAHLGDLGCEYSVKQTGNEFTMKIVTVDANGKVTIDPRFTGSYLGFTLTVRAKSTGAIVAKTIEKTIKFIYSNQESGSACSYAHVQFVDYRDKGYFSTRTLLNPDACYLPVGSYDVTSPITSAAQIPSRPGYYVDPDAMWLKYVGGVLDENWNGVFGYTKDQPALVEYRLNWQQVSFTASFVVNAPDGTKDVVATTDDVYYSESMSSFLVPIKDTAAYQVYGYDFSGFQVTSYDHQYRLQYDPVYEGTMIPAGLYYEADVATTGYEALYAAYLAHGLVFQGWYEEANYTVTLQNDKIYSLTELSYHALDYPSATGVTLTNAELPRGYKKDDPTFPYEIKSYLIKAMGKEDVTVTTLEGFVVTSDLTIHVQSSERYNLFTILSPDGHELLKYKVETGQAFPAVSEEDLRSALEAKTIVNKVAASYTIDMSAFASSLPATMPASDLSVTLPVDYVYKTVEVVFDGGEEGFASGTANVSEQDGHATVTFTGLVNDIVTRPRDAVYVAPDVRDVLFYKTRDGVYCEYHFLYWRTTDGLTCVSPGTSTPFYQACTYEPVYEITPVPFTVWFKTYSDAGALYFLASASGDYYGERVAQVFAQTGCESPVRTDEQDRYSYAFQGWNVPDGYTIGSDLDVNGKCKTSLVFVAVFTSSLVSHVVTFDADEGAYPDGTTQKTVTGVYTDILDVTSFVPSKEADGDNTYVFVGWSETRDNDVVRTDIDGGAITKDVTYYAVFKTNPIERTVTLRGGSVDGFTGYLDFSTDGYSGNSETVRTCRGLYDGMTFTLSASSLGVDSSERTYTPSCLAADDGTSVVTFIDGIASFVIDGDATYEVRYAPDYENRTYAVRFIAQGAAPEGGVEGATDHPCKGYLDGGITEKTYVTTYQATFPAPALRYTTDDGYLFTGWYRYDYDAAGNPKTRITYEAGETVTVKGNWTVLASYAYDATTTYDITFFADGVKLIAGTNEVMSVPRFANGSTSMTVSTLINTPVSFDGVPTLFGYRFKGWSDESGTVLASLGTCTEDKSFYAVYEKDTTTVTVTLSAGKGTFSGGATTLIVQAGLNTLASSLATPVANDKNQVFSYWMMSTYETVNVITESCALTAVYGYPITSFADLAKVSEAPSASYVLTQDLGGNEWGFLDATAGVDFTPLCPNDDGFSGVFNGGGHYIFANYTSKEDEYAGLFAKVSGKVMNLASALVVNIATNGTTSSCKAAGSLAGMVTASGLIENCFVTGSVNLTAKVADKTAVGNAVGMNQGTIHGLSEVIKRSVYSKDCVVESDGRVYLGGAIGYNAGDAQAVMVQYDRFKIGLANSAILYFGGIAGYNAGTLSRSSLVGSDTVLVLTNPTSRHARGSVSFGAVAGYDSGLITSCAFATQFGMTIPSVQVRNPLTDAVENFDELRYSRTYDYGMGINYERIDAVRDQTIQFTVFIDENAVLDSPSTQVRLAQYADKSLLMDYVSVYDYGAVAPGGKTYPTCLDMYVSGSLANSNLFAVTQVTDQEYGYVRYLHEHCALLQGID